jgi:hypothetical protein
LKRLLSALLVISALTGCKSTPQVVYLKPECSVPVRAELPTIDAGELWDLTGQELYDSLLQRERLIVDWAIEMQYMLTVICNGN